MKAVRDILLHLARTNADLNWFARYIADAPFVDVAPRTVPVLVKLRDDISAAMTDVPDQLDIATASRPMDMAIAAQGILDHADHFYWQQSYTTADPGIDEHYLLNYGWTNLVASDGHFVNDQVRISLGYWGPGLKYPIHSHAPEEWYLILAGGCRMYSEGRGSYVVGPGAIIHHTPFQRHGFDRLEIPLLALAFWRGDDLQGKSKMEGDL